MTRKLRQKADEVEKEATTDEEVAEVEPTGAPVEESEEALNAAQKYAVEQAFTAPLYTPKIFIAFRNKIVNWKELPSAVSVPFDAYIIEE